MPWLPQRNRTSWLSDFDNVRQPWNVCGGLRFLATGPHRGPTVFLGSSLGACPAFFSRPCLYRPFRQSGSRSPVIVRGGAVVYSFLFLRIRAISMSTTLPTTVTDPVGQQAVPAHIAIVMDGNGRWARQRLLPRLAGHRQGVQALRRCVGECMARGVRVLTVFAFSSENWARPAEEVSGLLGLLASALAREVPDLARQGVRLHFVGDRGVLSDKVRTGFAEAETVTAANTTLVLNVCFNYGGRWDIVQAAQRLCTAGQAVTEESFSAALSLAHVPDPDLLIRTGGECRVSNFLLWQLAYAELHFSPVLWPDFDAAALDAALADYAARERRFGRTSAQVQQYGPDKNDAKR